MATYTFAPLTTFTGTIDYIKVAMADSTLTDSGSVNKRDAIMSLICAKTEPLIVSTPYASGSGSVIVFATLHGAFTASALQTAVQAISGLGSATVAINQTLIG